jgi:hypothetical protein
MAWHSCISGQQVVWRQLLQAGLGARVMLEQSMPLPVDDVTVVMVDVVTVTDELCVVDAPAPDAAGAASSSSPHPQKLASTRAHIVSRAKKWFRIPMSSSE